MALAPIREPDFDPSLYDIRHVIDIGLQAKRSTRAPRTSDRWNAGSLGYCLRRQFLERAGVPHTKGEEYLASRNLWVGDALEEALQRMMTWSGLVISSQLHVVDEELHTSGYVDLIWGGEVPQGTTDEEQDYSPAWQAFLEEYRMQLRMEYIPDLADAEEPVAVFPVTGTEIKTAAQYSAEKMYGEGPQFHHIMQAADYALMCRRNPDQLPDFLQQHPIERWEITVIAKGNFRMLNFPILESHIHRVEDRLGALAGYWDDKQLPPCTCGVDIGWEKRYCAYRTGGGDKDPTCCGLDLIEQASDAFWATVEPESDTWPDVVKGAFRDDEVAEEVKHEMRRDADA